MKQVTAAKPLVLLHGFAGVPAAWNEVLSVLDKAGDLPREVLALPLAGHGSPPPTPGPGSFEAEADRLAAEIRQWRPAGPRCHLAGYSMGGRLALGLLLRHPELFSGATLIGAHWGFESPKEREARSRRDEAWASRLDTEGLESFLDAWEAQPLFSTQNGPQKAAFRRLRQTLRPEGLAAALRSFGTGVMPSHRRAVAASRLPTTWVAGRRDPKFVALSATAAEASPAGRAVTVPGAGHNVLLEAPEAVARILSTL